MVTPATSHVYMYIHVNNSYYYCTVTWIMIFIDMYVILEL